MPTTMLPFRMVAQDRVQGSLRYILAVEAYSQRAQYPSLQEYTLNYRGLNIMI